MDDLVSKAGLARLEGVTRQAVNGWIKSGRIEVEANGKIDPVKARRQLEMSESPMPHHQASKARLEDARTGADINPPEKTPQIGELAIVETYRLQKEEVAHRRNVAVMLEREWTAKQREIEARKAAGELCEMARVRDAWVSAFVILRSVIENMPSRAAPELAMHKNDATAIERTLAEMLTDALGECSSAFERALAGMGE